MEPYYTRGGTSLSGARRARRRSDRPVGERAVSVPRRVSTNRASSSCIDDLRRPAGCSRSTCRSASCSTKRNRNTSRCIRCETCDGFPCLLEREERRPGDLRRSGAGPSERVAVDQRTGAAARDQRRRDARSPRVVVERDGASSVTSPPTSSSSSCGAINSAALLLRSANDRHPAGLANGSGVVGRHYMGHINSCCWHISRTPNPTVFQKTLGRQRLLLRRSRVPVSDGAHLVRRQARCGGAVGRRAGAGARHDARPDGEALARLLADVRGPARSGQSRHARSRRQHRAVVHAEQRQRPQPG